MLVMANKISVAQRKGRYTTCIIKKTKLSDAKPIEVIYTAINWKSMKIVRVQWAKWTEITPTQLWYNINVNLVMLY